MPKMNPIAARLGSRPGRGMEGRFGQRIDGEFKPVFEDHDSLPGAKVVDVIYEKGQCKHCGTIGQIFRLENDYNICTACYTIQNDGRPEGNGMSKRAKKRANDNLIYLCLHSE